MKSTSLFRGWKWFTFNKTQFSKLPQVVLPKSKMYLNLQTILLMFLFQLEKKILNSEKVAQKGKQRRQHTLAYDTTNRSMYTLFLEQNPIVEEDQRRYYSCALKYTLPALSPQAFLSRNFSTGTHSILHRWEKWQTLSRQIFSSQFFSIKVFFTIQSFQRSDELQKCNVEIEVVI